MKKWQIHRFHDHVCIHMNNGETQYMTRDEAFYLFLALGQCQKDIANHPNYLDSQFRTEIGTYKGK